MSGKNINDIKIGLVIAQLWNLGLATAKRTVKVWCWAVMVLAICRQEGLAIGADPDYYPTAIRVKQWHTSWHFNAPWLMQATRQCMLRPAGARGLPRVLRLPGAALPPRCASLGQARTIVGHKPPVPRTVRNRTSSSIQHGYEELRLGDWHPQERQGPGAAGRDGQMVLQWWLHHRQPDPSLPHHRAPSLPWVTLIRKHLSVCDCA